MVCNIRHLLIYVELVLLVGLVTANLYSNTLISPNSAGNPNDKNEISKTESVAHSDKTIAPSEIDLTKRELRSDIKSENLNYLDIKPSDQLERHARSASSILSRTNNVDNFITLKNIEDSIESNDVELSGKMVDLLQPSKTESNYGLSFSYHTTLPLSGEGKRAPQGRSLQGPTQSIQPTATTYLPVIATPSIQVGKGRQANSDIQDIITGIVKLLNGNVNVQANTSPAMGARPLRPVSTRINNRGPPRITDVPVLPPDFDLPAPLPPPPISQVPNRSPNPYPFDLPSLDHVQGRPYPDQKLQSNKRPGIYRPMTIPPWNNRIPPKRPGFGNRRPTPIPPYKPIQTDHISLTSEKPNEDILNLDLGSHLLSNDQMILNATEKNLDEFVDVTTNTIIEGSETVDKETLDFEKNKEKVSLKTSKTTSITPTTPLSTSITNILSASSTLNPSPILETTTTSQKSLSNINTIQPSQTSNIDTFSSTVTKQTESLNTNSSLPTLESSMNVILETLKSELLDNSSYSNSHISTEKLPAITPTTLNDKKSISPIQNSTTAHTGQVQSQGFPYYPYRPRPGIVLDDPEYKPGGNYRQPIITRQPVGVGDVFDVTVSAIQGPGTSSGQGKPFVIPVEIDNVHGQDVITSPVGDNGFVSIDGKRTYLNLFGEVEPTSAASVIKPSVPTHNQVTGTGFAVVETEKKPNFASVKPTPRRPLYGRPKPTHPPVRIDTCIVGDDSTCDISQHEYCLTESGVSACHCRPGHARRKHRDICRKIVSILLSLRVDRLYERRVIWASELGDQTSDSYQQLSYEAERALESAMSMTPFSDEFLGAKVNGIYSGQRSAGQAGVFVNLTLQLEENAETSRPTVRADIQKHLLGVIQRRSNNVGNSALWVDSPPGSVSNLQDLDECSSPQLHDCHQLAKCTNIFGSFKCECNEGYKDPYIDSKYRAGRHCEQCPTAYCNNRGECKYQNGQEVCICSGNYYGNQCELDGEVLGVAIGASVIAIIIIGLTLVCLVMWSRKWSREQKAAVGSPVFGYMATASNTVKTPVIGGPPYQMTLEDRLRWAQLADAMVQANHYAPEPVPNTRPSSAMFGYPNLGMTGTMQRSMHGTLPPVPLPRLTLQAQMASRAASLHGGVKSYENSSSSEEEDKVDLLGRSFQVPRPKSRSNASIANQSGIYYDVDYDQHDVYKQGGGIPMNTYSMSRPGFFRN